MLVAYKKNEQEYVAQKYVYEINKEIEQMAYMTFQYYKEKSVLLNDVFDDMVWSLTNEKKRVNLSFHISKEIFEEKAKKWIGCSYSTYVKCMKIYILLQLGTLGLESLRDCVNVIKKAANTNLGKEVIQSLYLYYVVEFLKIIPGGSRQRDLIIEKLEEDYMLQRCNSSNGKQRVLADFNTYLTFNKCLKEFWKYAETKEKLFFFPLFFWWNITSILPLRPTELLLTPSDCLTERNNKNYLTVRRTKLKGAQSKIGYKISEDYALSKYEIPEWIAQEIHWYKENTKQYKSSCLETLFFIEPHYLYLKRNNFNFYDFYTITNLNTCLETFFRNVMGYENNRKVRLGDTRHIAMVNLIISGGSPIICKELAGHSDINISSHYYSNLSNFVECATLDKFRSVKGSKASIVGENKYYSVLPERKHRVSDGWCDNIDVLNGNVNECLKVTDIEGHIGACICCPHYWPDTQGLRLEFFDVSKSKKQVDSDVEFLMENINKVRKGMGYTEDIENVLLQLQRSCNHYMKCLWEKYSLEE